MAAAGPYDDQALADDVAKILGMTKSDATKMIAESKVRPILSPSSGNGSQ
jgi:hypothetical protein